MDNTACSYILQCSCSCVNVLIHRDKRGQSYQLTQVNLTSCFMMNIIQHKVQPYKKNHVVSPIAGNTISSVTQHRSLLLILLLFLLPPLSNSLKTSVKHLKKSTCIYKGDTSPCPCTTQTQEEALPGLSKVPVTVPSNPPLNDLK